jgi:hypothetical protein
MWTKVPPATNHNALTWFMSSKNLKAKPPAGFSTYNNTFSFLSHVNAENTTMLTPMLRKVYALPQS